MDVANGAFGQDVRYAPCASVYKNISSEYLDKLINVSPARKQTIFLLHLTAKKQQMPYLKKIPQLFL